MAGTWCGNGRRVHGGERFSMGYVEVLGMVRSPGRSWRCSTPRLGRKYAAPRLPPVGQAEAMLSADNGGPAASTATPGAERQANRKQVKRP